MCSGLPHHLYAVAAAVAEAEADTDADAAANPMEVAEALFG